MPYHGNQAKESVSIWQGRIATKVGDSQLFDLDYDDILCRVGTCIVVESHNCIRWIF